VTGGGIRKYYVKVNGRGRRGERGRGYNFGWLEACITEYNMGHKHGSLLLGRHVYSAVA
jgi:hypothetical protein